MNLPEVLSRAEADLRTIAKALAVAGYHADAFRLLGQAAMIAHDVPETLAAGEAALLALQSAAVDDAESFLESPPQAFAMPASETGKKRAGREFRPARRPAYLPVSG